MKTSAKSRKRAATMISELPAQNALPLKLIGAWLDFCGSPKRKTAQLLSLLSTMDRRQADRRYTVSSALMEDDMSKLPTYRLEVLVMSDMSISLTLFEHLPFELSTVVYTCALSTKGMAASAGNSRTPAAGLMAYTGSGVDEIYEDDICEDEDDLGEPIEVSPKRPTATRQRRQRRARAVSATK